MAGLPVYGAWQKWQACAWNPCRFAPGIHAGLRQASMTDLIRLGIWLIENISSDFSQNDGVYTSLNQSFFF